MTHSYKIHFFHLIWSTKNREKTIHPELQFHLYKYMGGIITKFDATLLQIGGMSDHVHLLIHLSNLDKYSALIRDVKSNSTNWVRKNYADLQNFEWQEGYASLSVSFSSLEQVKNYILNQEEHHKKMTFEEEYIKFLNHMGVKYDNRFVLG